MRVPDSLTVRMISSGSLVPRHIGTASTPPRYLKSRALPSMTGIPAWGRCHQGRAPACRRRRPRRCSPCWCIRRPTRDSSEWPGRVRPHRECTRWRNPSGRGWGTWASCTFPLERACRPDRLLGEVSRCRRFILLTRHGSPRSRRVDIPSLDRNRGVSLWSDSCPRPGCSS